MPLLCIFYLEGPFDKLCIALKCFFVTLCFAVSPVLPRMILSYFEDPADPFKLQMPKIYLEAKDKLDELNTLKDTAKEKLMPSPTSGVRTWF